MFFPFLQLGGRKLRELGKLWHRQAAPVLLLRKGIHGGEPPTCIFYRHFIYTRSEWQEIFDKLAPKRLDHEVHLRKMKKFLKDWVVDTLTKPARARDDYSSKPCWVRSHLRTWRLSLATSKTVWKVWCPALKPPAEPSLLGLVPR